MPSTSKKQHNFMAAIANNPAFAKKVGIKPSVGEEFLKADKSRKFKEGGSMKKVRKFVEGGLGFEKDVDSAALREAAMYGGLGKRNPKLPGEGIEQKYENTVTKKIKDAVAKTYSLSPSGVARSVASMGANAGRRAFRGTDNESSGMSDVVGAKKGGMMKHSDIKMDKKVVKKAVSMHDKQQHGGKKTDLTSLNKGGKVKKFALGGMSQEQMPPQMPSGLTMRRPFGGGASGAYGGLDVVNQGSQQVGKSLDTIGGALGTPGGGSMRPRLPGVIMKKGGAVKSKKMASGGKVGQLSKADGCAVKGKTKGRMV